MRQRGKIGFAVLFFSKREKYAEHIARPSGSEYKHTRSPARESNLLASFPCFKKEDGREKYAAHIARPSGSEYKHTPSPARESDLLACFRRFNKED